MKPPCKQINWYTVLGVRQELVSPLIEGDGFKQKEIAEILI